MGLFDLFDKGFGHPGIMDENVNRFLPRRSPGDIFSPAPRLYHMKPEPVHASSIRFGTPVYCDLGVVAEHTGIYVGDNSIIHLNGDGVIEMVSPEEFCARLNGLNPTSVVRFASSGKGKSLGEDSIGTRALLMAGKHRDYNFVLDNCHQFTSGCMTGDFENASNFFWMVEDVIRETFSTSDLEWGVWDY